MTGWSAAPGAESQILGALRDVPGIEGSFVVSDLGRLLARDMPSVFGDDVLGEVGPRVLRLRDTLLYAGDDLDVAMVRYADYALYLRPLGDGVLCVVASHEASGPAVKMAMHLAARRLDAPAGPRPVPLDPDRGQVVMQGPEGAPFPGRTRGYGY